MRSIYGQMEAATTTTATVNNNKIEIAAEQLANEIETDIHHTDEQQQQANMMLLFHQICEVHKFMRCHSFM
jgi:hypothetical protein